VTQDHVGVLGFVGDLAVAEKLPANFVSVERKKEPDMRVPLSVAQRLPPLFYLKSRFLAILQKSYLQFLSSRNCETDFLMIHGMASF